MFREILLFFGLQSKFVAFQFYLRALMQVRDPNLTSSINCTQCATGLMVAP